VPRQPGGKEPARKAAVCRAPTAQETAEMQPPEERSAAARRVQESGREREKWERRRRRAMLACCCDMGSNCWAVGLGRAGAPFGASRLGLAPQDFFYSSGVVRIFSLTKFQFNRGSC